MGGDDRYDRDDRNYRGNAERTAADIPGGPRCPFCGSTDTEELSHFASQLSTRQYVCRACHTPFEYFGRDSSAQ